MAATAAITEGDERMPLTAEAFCMPWCDSKDNQASTAPYHIEVMTTRADWPVAEDMADAELLISEGFHIQCVVEAFGKLNC